MVPRKRLDGIAYRPPRAVMGETVVLAAAWAGGEARAALAPMVGRDQMPATTGPRREDGMPDKRGDSEERTRERAYMLWQRAGSPEGRADEFWEQARRDEASAAEEARESFPASDPPSHTGITGEGRRGR